MRDMKRRRRTTLLKDASVRPVCRTLTQPMYDIEVELQHTSENPIDLHQALQVDIVALGSLSMAASHMM